MQHKTKPGFKWSFAEFKNALKALRLFFASFLLAIKEMKENSLLNYLFFLFVLIQKGVKIKAVNSQSNLLFESKAFQHSELAVWVRLIAACHAERAAGRSATGGVRGF